MALQFDLVTNDPRVAWRWAILDARDIVDIVEDDPLLPLRGVAITVRKASKQVGGATSILTQTRVVKGEFSTIVHSVETALGKLRRTVPNGNKTKKDHPAPSVKAGRKSA